MILFLVKQLIIKYKVELKGGDPKCAKQYPFRNFGRDLKGPSLVLPISSDAELDNW